MKCFKCQFSDCNFKRLMKHFQKTHHLTTYDTYQCVEENCLLFFSNSKSFRKHVIKQHTGTCNRDNTLNSHTSSIGDSEINVTADVTSPIISNEVFKSSLHNQTNLYLSIDSDNNSENSSEFAWDTEIEKIHFNALSLILDMHSHSNINRSDVYKIQSNIIKFITTPLIESIYKFIKCKMQHIDDKIRSELHFMLNEFKNPFKLISTDYKFAQYLHQKNLIHHAEEFSINNEISEIMIDGQIQYSEVDTKGVILPLEFQFTKLFEKDNNLEIALNYIEKANQDSSSLNNFFQGLLWKTKLQNFNGKIVIPYFLYFDETEINNPLGSHATTHSVANMYYSFPCLDMSKLENIFLGAIIKSIDLKNFGTDSCLQYLIDKLKRLEEIGLVIQTSTGPKIVYFVLGLVLGDNLGLNVILDFSKSFSATSFCRFCKILKDESKFLAFEKEDMMRNQSNYFNDCQLANLKTTGVNKNSVFNQIKSFNVTQNFAVDIMHDFYEGVCHYDLCHIILYFIEEAQYFSLEILNTRKQLFNYGYIEKGNISQPIKIASLKSFKLKMSAKEMKTFIYFFPLMVGDLIPIDDEVWLFFLELLEIVDLILSNQMNLIACNILAQKIQNHHKNYLKLFKDNLKPKHHLITHYPTVIQYSGPPRQYWCFRYEAKHKEFKIYAHSITSRKNICLTLAKKYQLKFANYIHVEKNLDFVDLIAEKKFSIKSNHTMLFKKFQNDIIFESYSEIIYKGTQYKSGLILTQFWDEMCVFEIKELVVNLQDNEIVVVCQPIKMSHYDSHFAAYLIDPLIREAVVIKKLNEFSGPPINYTKLANGSFMFRPKQYF